MYSFCVSSQVAGDSSEGQKQISLTVLPVTPCSVKSCNTCVACDSNKCVTCSSGYTTNSDQSLCVLTSNQLTTTQILVVSIFGIAIPTTMMLSAFNLSSMTSIFLICNQMRILIFLLLTEVYFPEALINYITGFKFALFSFSFISIQDVEGLNKLLSWADIPQHKSYLYEIGLTSRSAVYNNANLLFSVCLLILIHIGIRIVFYLVCKLCQILNCKKCRDFVKKLVKMFECGIYIRILLESLQFSLISTFSEINEFSLLTTATKCSFAISVIMSLFNLLFCIMITVLLVKTNCNKVRSITDSEELKFGDCWYGEVFKDTKNTLCSRAYTILSAIRVILLVSVLIFSKNYSDKLLNLASSKIYFLIIVQLMYTILVCIVRPFDKIDSNIILIINEASFFILSCFLINYNSESRWNNAAINIFEYFVTFNSVVTSCIVIRKFSIVYSNSQWFN